MPKRAREEKTEKEKPAAATPAPRLSAIAQRRLAQEKAAAAAAAAAAVPEVPAGPAAPATPLRQTAVAVVIETNSSKKPRRTATTTRSTRSATTANSEKATATENELIAEKRAAIEKKLKERVQLAEAAKNDPTVVLSDEWKENSMPVLDVESSGGSSPVGEVRSARSALQRMKEKAVEVEDEDMASVVDEDEVMEDVVEAVVEPVREQVLSTFVPSEENHKVSKDGTQTFKLQPGETLVIVGIYTLTVLKGSVHVLGTKLSSSSAPSTIYAPLTHSLPVLTAAVKKNTDAPTKISYIELHITPYSSPLLNIGRLLPTFTNIWGNQEGSTFTPLFTSTTPTPILSVPQSHTTLLKSISRSSSSSDPIILLTGAKSAGKSTLSRLLTNSLLRNGPVAYLDLDPGQPELSPPGMISLTLLSSPLLGPSFTHFTHKPKPTKQHHIGYPTPREDPGAYMRCVIDLLNTHRSQHPRVPLIINTFGWIKALGLELLTDIAQHAQVTDVIFLGGGGSAVAEVLGQGITFHELSSAASMATAQAGGMGGSGRFSPADLRALQTAAYFHPEDFSPLTHMKPWVVPYPGAIAGIDVLGEVIDAADTRDAVEGTVVGVLLVEDVMEPVMVGKGLPLVVGVAPEGAECVGLAVVRAVDTEKQEVQLLMPVTGEEIAGWGEKQVVLQRGRGEIGLVEMLTGKEYKDGEAPWLQMGGKDKGKVWRVRRNVMRRGQQ